MIYVPPGLHRAMKQAALDDGDRFISEVYVEAAQAFLASRGLKVGVEGASENALGRESTPSIADLVGAIEGLGKRLEEALEHGSPPRPVEAQPAGSRAAEAMRVVLEVLRKAGSDGLSATELSRAVHGRGVRSGAEEAAKAVLRAAGLVRCEGRRWLLDGFERTG
ncbi:hypothetical protein [Methylobacterium radiodurans]|uniref:Uncharacterized protein n=1 Tax=Methylobacterium radiodurans TaxID=2202828 RepID=A0A2U8VWR2_9HYPH|nr:hypothetical protein [Methylobacterium radiodurans]AWN37652.1 hypothetical protein DK427_19560 [Methylobacterium radiodurans]